MISDFVAMAVVGVMPIVITIMVMVVLGISVHIVGVAAFHCLDWFDMADSIRRMRVRRRAEEETHSKQQPTKHLERTQEHARWLALE